jgi:hypothetical protein
MTRGFGVMPDYAQQIVPEDRWAIAAYVKALQLSQRVPASELSVADRGRVEAETRKSEIGDRKSGPGPGH